MAATKTSRQAQFVAVLLLVCVAVVAIAAESLMMSHPQRSWLLDKHSSENRLHDPILGWINLPSRQSPDRYGPGKHFTTNARSFRALEEYEDSIPPGRFRVICLGDSFTEGTGVGDSEVYAARLEVLDPSIQAVNMGEGGYGVDQAILRHEVAGDGLDADLVLLAMIPDDLNRTLWDRFLVYLPKPRFELTASQELELRSVPVPNFTTPVGGPLDLLQRSGLALILRRLYFQHVVQQSVESLAPALFERFAKTAASRGQQPVIVYLPVLNHLMAHRFQGSAMPQLDLVSKSAQKAGLRFVNLTPAFLEIPPDEMSTYFLADWGEHYSSKAHELTAREIMRQLEMPIRNPPLDPTLISQ